MKAKGKAKINVGVTLPVDAKKLMVLQANWAESESMLYVQFGHEGILPVAYNQSESLIKGSIVQCKVLGNVVVN